MEIYFGKFFWRDIIRAMALPERLQKHLNRERSQRGEQKFKLPDDYVEKLPLLPVGDEVTLHEIRGDTLEDVLFGADLTKGQRAGINRLFSEINSIYTQGEWYEITVGDIRRMTNEEMMLLGGGPSEFHPKEKSVRILRALFGEKRVE
jgi:hypothetical protein